MTETDNPLENRSTTHLPNGKFAPGNNANPLGRPKQKTMKDAGAIELEITNAKGQWTYITEIAKKQADFDEANLQTQAKIISTQIMADAKVIGHHISTEGAKEKQEIANKKPVPKKAKTA